MNVYSYTTKNFKKKKLLIGQIRAICDSAKDATHCRQDLYEVLKKYGVKKHYYLIEIKSMEEVV